MRRVIRALTCVLAAGLIASIGLPGAVGGTQRLTPSGPVPLPENGALFGAFVKLDEHNGLERRQAMLDFEALAERQMAIDRQYYLWDEPFPTADDEWSRDMGRTLYISWNGNASTPELGCANWADIAAGLYDADIDARAAAIKAFGAPMFFTFHHEPMTAPPPGYESCGTADEFIAAWRYVRDRFIADGVDNVTWSWTVTAWSFDQFNAETYYPGDDAVDVIAADGYNWFGCPHHQGPWREFDAIFQRFYDFGIEHGKPMAVAEYGTGEDDADPNRKANWFTNAAETLKGWPEIKGLSYFNVGGGGSCARYIDSSEASRASFAAMGADPYFNPTTATTVTVSDFKFDPSTVQITQGTDIQWDFQGPSTHTATDATGMGLFDSGPMGPGSTYLFSFVGAGKYRYKCTIHPSQMKGTVQVPLVVSPDSGDVNTQFTVTWASEDAPAGYAFDIRIKRPGSPGWQTWLNGQTSNSATFVPDAGEGQYTFSARLRNTTNGKRSAFSADASIQVTNPPARDEHVGDFNGDGLPDLITAAPEDDVDEVSDAGVVHILYSDDKGIDISGNQSYIQDTTGLGVSEPGDFFGRMEATGDFNADGYYDAAMAAIRKRVGGMNHAGAVYVLYGSPAGLQITDPPSQLWTADSPGMPGDGAGVGDIFGGGMHAADWNGDGFADLAIGAWCDTISGLKCAGSVTILFGSGSGLSTDGAQLWSQDTPGIQGDPDDGDEFGRQITDGDWNADGYADISIGVRLDMVNGHDEAGGANVIYGCGALGGLQADPGPCGNPDDQYFTEDTPGFPGDGAQDGEWLGRPVTNADFDNDGIEDLLIGARYETVNDKIGAGGVFVLYGTPAGLTLTGSQEWTMDSPGMSGGPAEEGDQFGHQAGAGDFNADGFDDVALNALEDDVGSLVDAGSFTVLYGSTCGLQADPAVCGGPDDQFWNQDSPGVPDVAEAGAVFGFYLWSKDFNQDGWDDLAASAPFHSVSGVLEAGTITVFYGQDEGIQTNGITVWSQDTTGMKGDGAEQHDLFGGIIQ